jgi:hypothetical protein
MSMPFELLPSKRRITVPSAGQISEIDDAGAAGGALSAGALRDGDGDCDDTAGPPLLRVAPLDEAVEAVLPGGATRST